ncbi:MAG: antibiotic biosynthesis monooxygenase [Acidimicrobiaceae bacterium]|nr:antibiotic biosynthesis monooxygenase [Acidimicrobiaceae bacterium]
MASTPPPPYVAVLFTNRLAPGTDHAYDTTVARMLALAQTIDGFFGIESIRAADQTGITISYWRDYESIETWRTHPEHLDAQAAGRREWYDWYELRIAEVTRASSYTASNV